LGEEVEKFAVGSTGDEEAFVQEDKDANENEGRKVDTDDCENDNLGYGTKKGKNS
jgi:hypothetical protein